MGCIKIMGLTMNYFNHEWSAPLINSGMINHYTESPSIFCVDVAIPVVCSFHGRNIVICQSKQLAVMRHGLVIVSDPPQIIFGE